MSTPFLAQVTTDVRDIRISDSITLCCFVVLIYDFLLTFPKEVKYIWKANWTWGKALFIVNRYGAMGVSTILTVAVFDGSLGLKFCEVTDLMEGWSMPALIIPVQLILCLRTTALWEKSRKIIYILVAITIISDGIIATFVWLEYRSVQFTANVTAVKLAGCNGDESSNTSRLIVPAVAALIVFDTAIFILTITRVGRYRRAGEGRGRIVKIFFRDGLAYYAVMFFSSAANLTMYAVIPQSRPALGGSVLPILRSTISICASRLVLNLRGSIEQTRLTRWEGSELTGGSTLSLRQSRTRRRLRKSGSRTRHPGVPLGPDTPPFELTIDMRDAIALQEMRRLDNVNEV